MTAPGRLYRIKELASIVYHNSYSEEDYNAFLTYNKGKSHLTIFLTCLAPVVAVSVTNIVSLMLFPLPWISEGFLGSASLSIIVFMGPFVGCAGFVYVLLHFFPGYHVKWYVMTALCTISGLTNLAFLSFLTTFCWPFPMSVPVSFTPVLPILVTGIYFSVLKEAKLKELNFWLLLKSFVKTIFLIWTMMLTFPVIKRFWDEGLRKIDRKNGSWFDMAIQYAAPALLFIIRRIVKKLVISVCETAGRPAPFLAVVAIDAFHVIYISILIEEKASLLFIGLILLYDTVNNIIQFHQIKKLRRQYSGSDLWGENNTRGFSTAVTQSKVSVNTTSTDESQENKIEIRKKILQLSENLVLLEYVQCIVPAIVAIFSIWFYIYPVNRAYFSPYKNQNYRRFAESQMFLWTFAFLEFFVRFVITKIGCFRGATDTPVWGQLGYVLSKQMKPTIAILLIGTIYANTMAVEHLGSGVPLTCYPPRE